MSKLPLDMERNVCGCKVCRLHCRIMPSFLLPEDIIPLMGETGFLEPEEFGNDGDKVVRLDVGDVMPWAEKFLLASDGSIVKFGDKAPIEHGNAMRVPTLVPRSKKNNACIFYDKKAGLCDVHENSPFGCRMFDCKMDSEEGDHRSTLAAVRLAYMWDVCRHRDVDELSMSESMYCSMWLHLSDKGLKRDRSTVQLKLKLQKEIEKMKRGKEE